MSSLHTKAKRGQRPLVVRYIDVPPAGKRTLDIAISDGPHSQEWFVQSIRRAGIEVGAIVRDLVGEQRTAIGADGFEEGGHSP